MGTIRVFLVLLILLFFVNVSSGTEVYFNGSSFELNTPYLAEYPFSNIDKAFIEQSVLNEMYPVEVNNNGDKWEISGMYFESILKKNANDNEVWSYIENDNNLAFTYEEMRWDNNELLIYSANPSNGELNDETLPVSITYLDALNDGVNIKITQDNYQWQKIVEIESLESLGEIPEDAEYLEISFKVSGDFNLPEGTITDPILIGENSFIQPVQAWDDKNDYSSGVVGTISEDVITKRISIEWLRSASYPVQTDLTITYGAEYVFNSVCSDSIAATALDSTHFVIAYRHYGDTPYKGGLRLGTVSGTTISYGAEYIFEPVEASQISITAINNTHFIVTYCDEGNGDYGTARVGSVSGTTITCGAEYVFNAAGTYSTSVGMLNDTHFVVAYQDIGNSQYGTAIIGVVSGTTISSWGSEYVFNSARTDTKLAVLNDTHFVVTYQDFGNLNYGTGIVGNVSGTTITYGSESVFNAATTYYSIVTALDSTHFAVAYRDLGSSSYGTAIIGATSGTTITSYGAENVFNTAGTYYIGIATLDDTNFVVSYQDGGNSYGTATVGTVSGTTITYESEDIFNAGTTYYTGTAALDSTYFVTGYRDAANSDYGTAIIGNAAAAPPPTEPPDPISLNYNADYYWMNWTWAGGSGPVNTDSFNVSINGGWNNGSSNTYYNHYLPSGGTSTIIVWAYNASHGTLSNGSITDSQTTVGLSIGKWTLDSSIKAGLGDIGSYSKPNVFDDSGTWKLIAGNSSGTFTGFEWNGTLWVSNSSIVNGLGSIGSESAPTVFNDDGTLKLITGNYNGGFSGFQWNGSSWVSNSSLVTGLGDVGKLSTPTVFDDSGTWKLISGEESGVFNGYEWNGSTWVSDSSIVIGLGDVGQRSAPHVFKDLLTWKLIAGEYNGGFTGYRWCDNSWVSDSSIVTGIGSVYFFTGLTVFNDSNTWKFIAGDFNGGFTAYFRSPGPSHIPPDPINLANSTHDYTVNFTFAPGSGNNTDMFFVSTNNGTGVVWNNSSLKLFSNTSTSSRGYVKIDVYGYNESGEGTFSTGYLTDNVTVPNSLAITNTKDWYSYEQGTVSVNYNAYDLDGDIPIFSCNRTDIFTNFNTATGVGSWITSVGDAGTHYVDFGVSDGYGSDNYTMNITVLPAIAPGEWEESAFIVNGLGGLSGGWPTPEVFTDGEMLKLIMGESYGEFHGFYWNGTYWLSDSDIISGLPADIGSYSALSIFNDSGTLKLIAGREAGNFLGFYWSDSVWVSDSSIVAGLGDVGSRSSPEIFSDSGVWKIIIGNNTGLFTGFEWNGTSWVSNSSIVIGLLDVGDASAPEVFNDNGTLKLISGESQGYLNPYYWNGTTWISDPNNIIGLPEDVGSYSTPEIYHNDGVWNIIIGETYDYNGYQKSNEPLAFDPSIWELNQMLVIGLTDVGYDSTPTIFNDSGIFKLISGNSYGVFYGFYWGGSAWVSDSSIVTGLGDVGYDSTPTVFGETGAWKLISGNSYGHFIGYQWNGTSWVSDLSIVAGLEDAGGESSPTVFYINDTWYLITGHSGPTFYGYEWDGIWVANTSIISGLDVAGDYLSPTVYNKNGSWKLLSGEHAGTFTGFQWNGTGWEDDLNATIDLGDVGTSSKPAIYYDSENLILISGEYDGVFNGYQTASSLPPTFETPLPTSVVIIPTSPGLETNTTEGSVIGFSAGINYITLNKWYLDDVYLSESTGITSSELITFNTYGEHVVKLRSSNSLYPSYYDENLWFVTVNSPASVITDVTPIEYSRTTNKYRNINFTVNSSATSIIEWELNDVIYHRDIDVNTSTWSLNIPSEGIHTVKVNVTNSLLYGTKYQSVTNSNNWVWEAETMWEHHPIGTALRSVHTFGSYPACSISNYQYNGNDYVMVSGSAETGIQNFRLDNLSSSGYVRDDLNVDDLYSHLANETTGNPNATFSHQHIIQTDVFKINDVPYALVQLAWQPGNYIPCRFIFAKYDGIEWIRVPAMEVGLDDYIGPNTQWSQEASVRVFGSTPVMILGGRGYVTHQFSFYFNGTSWVENSDYLEGLPSEFYYPNMWTSGEDVFLGYTKYMNFVYNIGWSVWDTNLNRWNSYDDTAITKLNSVKGTGTRSGNMYIGSYYFISYDDLYILKYGPQDPVPDPLDPLDPYVPPTPTPTATPTGYPTSTPIIVILDPTPTPEPIPLEFLLPEQLEDTIFEEILTFIGKIFSWLFILAAYFGAFVASVILMKESEDLNDTKYSILLFGTLGWIVPLIINSIHLMQLVTQSFILNAIIFAGFGLVTYAVLNMFSGED